MGSPGDEHPAPPEPPQSDLPSSSGFGIALLGLAWLSCVIGIGYSVVYMIGMGMSPTGRGPSASEAIATSVWFMISAVAILTYVKRQRPGTAATILLALPGAVTALGLLFALPGQMDNPLAVLLILIIPAAAAVYDFASHPERTSGWALEAVLVASLILTPAWIATHGFDFGELRSELKQEAADNRKREARQKLFDSLSQSLEGALPKEIGTWRLVETMGPHVDPATHSKFAQEKGWITTGLWALYEDSASKSDDPDLSEARFKQHIETAKSQLEALWPEMEYLHDRKEYPGLTKDQENRWIFLNHEREALLDEQRWDAKEWQQRDEHEKVITVMIEPRAPGDKVDEDIKSWKGKVEGTTPAQGFAIPWSSSTTDGRLDDYRFDECVIGRISDSGHMKVFAWSLPTGKTTPQFTSAGLRITVGGVDHGKTDQFVRALDLSGLMKLAESAPTDAFQSP